MKIDDDSEKDSIIRCCKAVK